MGPLATEEQLAADAAALEIVARPEMQAAIDRALEETLVTPAGQAAGPVQTERYLRDLANQRALVACNCDPRRPAMILVSHDHAKMGLDNPDTLYRTCVVDAAETYRIRGRLGSASDVSFQILDAISGDGAMGGTVGFFDGRKLVTDADGSFELLVTASGEQGPNVLALVPGAKTLTARDTLGDWNETPMDLSIECVGSSGGWVADTGDDAVAHAVELFDAARAFWPMFASFVLTIDPNVLTMPVETPAGLTKQLSSAGHVQLHDGEALVVRAAVGVSTYFGCQFANHHFVSVEHVDRCSSRNHTQAVMDDREVVTLVVSPVDPGVANWIDTDGLTDGLLVIRWQGVDLRTEIGSPQSTVVRLEDVADVTGLPAVDAAARTAELVGRRLSFDRRWRGRRPIAT